MKDKRRKSSEAVKETVCLQCSKIFMGFTCHYRKFCSQSCAGKYNKIGELNGQWKGDKVGYSALHEWIKNHFPKPKLCVDCKENPPYDLANISQEYKRELSDWEWLCRRCHMIKDGRMNKLKEGREVLTEKQVIEMRVTMKNDNKKTYREMGKKYGVSPPTIWYAVRRKTWKYI